MGEDILQFVKKTAYSNNYNILVKKVQILIEKVHRLIQCVKL